MFIQAPDHCRSQPLTFLHFENTMKSEYCLDWADARREIIGGLWIVPNWIVFYWIEFALMHSLIWEYDSRWCFSYLPKRAPRSKDLLTVLPKPISLPKPITLNPLCIFVTTSLLKIRISPWWMLNKTTLLSHILLTFNKLLCKFASKINVTELLSLTRDSGCKRGAV